MIAARSSRCVSHWARRSSRSTAPSAVALTTTTRMPAITADAALVPWAELGIRHTSRARSPLPRGGPGGGAPRGPAVGLDEAGVLPVRRRQPALDVGDQLPVALGVGGRRERVQVGEAGQAGRLPLGGRGGLYRGGGERGR